MTETAILERSKNPFSSFDKDEDFEFVTRAAMASGVPVGESSLCGTRGAVLHGELGAVFNSGNSDASRPAVLSAVVSPSTVPDQPAHFGSSNFQAHFSSALTSVCSI